MALLDLGERRSAFGKEAPEFIFKVIGFPGPANKVVVRLHPNREGRPSSGEGRVFVWCCVGSTDADQLMINVLNGSEEVGRDGWGTRDDGPADQADGYCYRYGPKQGLPLFF